MSELTHINHTISNLSIGNRLAIMGGIGATRRYAEAVGARDGIAWTALVRSRLYAEIMALGAVGRFKNVVGGVALIASLDQSFAPDMSKVWDRFWDSDDGMRVRLQRLGNNVLKQRLVMPPVMKSLGPMRRVASVVDNPQLFATLYAEDLPDGHTYNQQNAPYLRTIQLTPDVLEKLGVSIHDLPQALARAGIQRISYSPYNAARRSQSGQTQIGSWRSYLADFAGRGLIRQLTVSLNRTDLPEATGADAAQGTFDLAAELIKDNARQARMGELPEQVSAIVSNHLGGPLDITIRGTVSGYEPEQIRNVFYNLDELARS